MMIKIILLVITISGFFSSCEERQPQTTVDTLSMAWEQDRIRASKTYLRAWSENDIELMKSISATDLVRYENGEATGMNLLEIAESMKYWHTAIPDLNLSVSEVIVSGRKSYASWTCTGTNTGKFGEAPPTGKKSKTEGITVLTFSKDGLIMHEAAYFDLLGVIEGWGYTVTPPIME